MKRTTRNRIVFYVLIIGALVTGGVAFRMRRVQASTELPTAAVRKGEFLVLVRSRGELTARQSVQINAPRNIP